MAKPSHVVKWLDVMVTADQPGMLWGKPGVGKSSMVKQTAERHRLRFIDIRLSQLDPVDLRGLPYVEQRIAHFAPPAMLPQPGEQPALVFLDEMAQAPQLVQNAASELLLDRKLGEYNLPDGCRLMAASNRKSDRAATVEIPTHLRNRLAHIEVDSDLEEWLTWAIPHGIHEQITGFLRFRPNHLCHPPEKDVQAFATPRTWEFLSRALPHAKGEGILRMLVSQSIVGPGVASEFLAYCEVFADLPDADAILKDPENPIYAPKKYAGKPSVMFALCAVLARRVGAKNQANFFKYLKGIPTEFQVCCLQDARSAWPEIKATPGYSRWANDNQDIILGS